MLERFLDNNERGPGIYTKQCGKPDRFIFIDKSHCPLWLSMFKKLRLTQQEYPPQFWLLFWGMLISTAGASMIWPFLMIYVSDRLDLPMTSVASLMTLNAGAGLLASLIVGPIADRVGRKITMIIGLGATGLLFLAMIPAKTLVAFAILMTLRGFFNPLYRVGSDAMVADLIPESKRPDAYALTRLSKNVGVAMGPAVGGFVATASYSIAFWAAAIGLVTFSLLMVFFAKETLPGTESMVQPETVGIRSYQKIFKDRGFMYFVLAFTLAQIGSTIVWVLLGVYTKQNYGILENQYGLIPMTNAIMVVIMQVSVTRFSKRYQPLLMMALGAFFYAGGVTSVALATDFWGFWISMVIITMGELILIPTAATYVANIAPQDMRGRYMSLFSLSWGVAAGIGPVIGGYLNDNISPLAIWYGGGLIGFIGAVWFYFQFRNKKAPEIMTIPEA
jgi:MFS family permease